MKKRHGVRRRHFVVGWGLRSGGELHGLGLVFELCGGALFVEDTFTLAEKNRLVDGAGFLAGVKIPAFHNFAGFGDFVVGWNGDIARRSHLAILPEHE